MKVEMLVVVGIVVWMLQLDVTSFPRWRPTFYMKCKILNAMSIMLRFGISCCRCRCRCCCRCRCLFICSTLKSALIHTKCVVEGLFTLVRHNFWPRHSPPRIIFRQYSAKFKLIPKYGARILPDKYYFFGVVLPFVLTLTYPTLSNLQHACAA